MKFTIITPIYNRSHFLKRLYNNISSQHYSFEWIIIDDGSTDGSKEEADRIIKKNNTNLSIRYFWQENRGKSKSVNIGFQEAVGEWTIILDSDDLLTDEFLTIVDEKISLLDTKTLNLISGFIFLKKYMNNSLVGQKYRKGGIPIYHYERAKIKGDKLRVTKTSILKKNIFPEYEEEKYVTEDTIWNQIESKYPVIPYNIYGFIGDYLPDGITSEYDQIIEINFNGTFHYVISSLEVTSFNIFRDLGLYRGIFGHYFHIRNFDRNTKIIKKFFLKGFYFLFWFYIYRIISYIFYNDFKK